MILPKLSTSSRATTEFSACRTCSIQMIVMPACVDPRMVVDQRAAFALGQAAGDLVEQQQSAARSPARAPVPAACGRAGSSDAGRMVGLVDQPGLVEDVARSGRPTSASRLASRRRRRRPAGSRTRSVSRRAAGSGSERPTPARQRCIGGSAGDVAADRRSIAAGVGRAVAGDQVEQRRLAGAVRADDAQAPRPRARRTDTQSDDRQGAEAISRH